MGAGTQLTSPNHNQFTKLNGGATAYTVTTTQITTNCSSSSNIVVTNTQVLPTISTTVVGSTNCAGGTANGSMTVSSVVPADTYSYRWFDKTPTLIVGQTGATLSGRQGGASEVYTAEVTLTSTGCVNTASNTIPDSKVLPSVTLASLDNTVCSPATNFTGKITATPAVGVTTDYTFALTAGMGAGTQLASPNHNQFTKLNGGATAYTVTTTQITTNCSSSTNIVVNNTQVLPTISTTVVGSTNCAGGTANGSMTVSSVTPAGPYSYRWFDKTPTLIVGQTGATLSGRQGGASEVYTAEVTLSSTGCINTASNTIPDSKVLPSVTLASVDNTVCSPATNFTGKITATPAVGVTTDYTFALTAGMGAGTQLASPNHNQFTKLNGGATAYTVTTTQITTNCSSSTNIVVNNTQVLPTISTTVVGSTNCAGGTANGSMTVSSVTPVDTYSYRWFDKTNTVITGQTASNLTGLQGGASEVYTAEVTLSSTGCINTASNTIPDSKAMPVLTLVAQPNTICDPLKAIPFTPFDGQVSASVNTVGNYAGSVAGDFTFTWNTGLSGIGQNILLTQDVGTYSVTATHTNTGCQSTLTSANVTSAKKLPSISMDQAPSTNCATGTPDGIAKVLDVLPHGNNYTYKWFNGNSTSGTAGPTTLNTALTTDNYSGVQGGISGASLLQYTVEVTILQTGCVNTATVGVSDDSQVPVLGPLTPTNNTLCSVTKNGAATVSTLNYRAALVPPASYSDYTFSWSTGGTQGPPETYTALAAGNYTLTAQNNISKCTSNPVSVTISDNLFIPPINVLAVDQTSCDTATPNGSLTATIDETALGGSTGVTTGYTFTWVDDVTSGTISSGAAPANAISNLKGNQNYTITAFRNLTQCTSTQISFLNETLVLPTVMLTPTGMTSCSPYNGKLVASPLTPTTTLTDYDYFWYDGSGAASESAIVTNNNAGLLGVVATNTYNQLVPQDYTIVIRDKVTQCVSSQVISTVANLAPPINPEAENTMIPATCNATGGELTGAVRLTPLTDFHALAATSQLTLAAPLALTIGEQIIIGRNAALTLPNGLLEDQTYLVENIISPTVITLKDLGNVHVNLTTDGDGTISDFKTAGYSFNWYNGVPTGTNPTNPINYFTNPPDFGALVPSSTNPSSIYNGIPSGLYSLEVTDNITQCKNFISQTLPFIGSHAVIKISKTNSTVCAPSPDDGSITIEIEDPVGAPGGATYDISLSQGGTPVGATIAGVPQLTPTTVSSTLAPGTYVVSVKQDYGSNCSLDQDVVIGRDALPPVITLTGPIISNTACDPTQVNGEIDLNVDKDPADLTAVTPTYGVTMTPAVAGSNFPVASGSAAGPYSAIKLSPATYIFTATASTGCVATKSFTVVDNPTKSILTAANISVFNAEYCDPNLEVSAKVVINEVDIVGGTGPEKITDYQFDWYTDATLSTNVFSSLGSAASPAGGDEFINNVPPGSGTVPAGTVKAGSYWVVATKKTDLSGTGGLGCLSTPFSLTIAPNKVNPQLTLTPAGDPSCDLTVFQGSITVDATTASGPGSLGGVLYDYAWIPNGGAGQPTNSIGSTGTGYLLSNINDGTYTLTALNEATGCTSTLATTVIKIAPPVFTLDAAVTNETNCGPFDGKIDNLQVFVNGVAGTVLDFDYVWYRSNLVSAPVLDGTTGPPPPVDDQLTSVTYPGIGLDTYFVKGIRAGGGAGIGCESAALRKYILDDRAYPQISFSTIANTSCDTNYDGQITVTAATASGPGAGSNYNFVWTSDPDGAGALFSAANSATNNTASPFATVNTDLIGPGGYTIRVTNFVTQCFTDGNVNVSQNTIPMSVSSVTSTNVDLCSSNNGSGTLVSIAEGAGAGVLGNYSYTWASNSTMVPSIGTGLTQNNLAAGTYYVMATRNAVVSPLTPGVSGSGCVTAPAPLTVLDKRVFPTVSFATIASSSCDANYDGKITVTAATATGPGAGPGDTYNFVWTSDPDGGGPLFSASNSATNNTASPFATVNTDLIGPGGYTIRVTNFVTQCFTDGNVNVSQNTIPMSVSSVTSTNVDLCSLQQWVRHIGEHSRGSRCWRTGQL